MNEKPPDRSRDLTMVTLGVSNMARQYRIYEALGLHESFRQRRCGRVFETRHRHGLFP